MIILLWKVVDDMNLNFEVNEYLLAWYLLYGASLSKEIDKFRKSLWSKFQKEYNFCHKDKGEILKYGKDFIPDNDVLYEETFKSDLYLSLKKETIKHKMHLIKIFHSNDKEIKEAIKDVIKIKFKTGFKIYVVHPRMECIEFHNNNDTLIWGSDKDKYDVLTLLILNIIKGTMKEEFKDSKEILDSVMELAVINEIGNRLESKENYELGNPTLKIIKRQIYPFWLMYLGYDSKETLLNKMIEDKIAFDIENYPIDKNMKKMDLEEFISFCIKNNKHILKLGNVLQIEQEEEIEII